MARDARSEVSAVMLTRDQWEYTRRCLESLRPDLDAGMELIVVDSGSTDGTPSRVLETVETGHRVKLVESPVNLGFPVGSNLGSAAAGGRYLLYANNDVVFPAGWLGRLMGHLERNPSAGLVGPRSNRIAGQQLLQPVPYDEDSLEGFDAFASRLSEERADQAAKVSRLIGFCLLARREVVDRIGGFDPAFGVGNFEDDDFCLRARLAGFELLQAEDVIVHHFGGRSFAGAGVDRNRAILRNWELFKRKWGLPGGRSVHRFYTPGDFDHLRFDPVRHHVALPPGAMPIEEARGFNFLLVADPEGRTWEAPLRAYLAAFSARDDVALLLRLPAGGEPEAPLARVREVAGSSLDGSGDGPEVVVVDLPLGPGEDLSLFAAADAVLVGEGDDERAPRQLAELAGRPVIEAVCRDALRAAAGTEGRLGSASPRPKGRSGVRLAHVRDPHRSRALQEEAEEALGRSDRAAAITSLEAARRFGARNGELPLLAAMLHLEAGRTERAAALATEALAVRPFNPSAMNFLGVLCLDAGNAALAKKVLRRTVEAAPDFARVRDNLRDAERAARRRGRDRARAALPVADIESILGPRPARLSACVLMRDVSEPFDDCLESLAGLADEIVVADRTCRLNKETVETSEGTVVVHVSRGEDAASARNEALLRCTGDWVLVLDAGERLRREGREALRTLVDGSRCLFHAVEVRRREPDGLRLEIRLFRNASGLEFRGCVFEDIRPSLLPLRDRWGMAGGTAQGVVIEAPLPDRPVSPGFLEEEVASDPEDAYARVNGARMDLGAGRPDRALERLRQARAALGSGDDVDLEEPTTLEGYALMRLGRYAELDALVKSYHESHPPTANTLFLEAVASKFLGRPEETARLARKAREARSRPSYADLLPEAAGAQLSNLLGAALLDLKDLDGAAEAFREAAERDPESLDPELGLLGIRLSRGEVEALLRDLDRLVGDHGDDPRLWLAGTTVLMSMRGLEEAAASWAEEGARRFPHREDMRARLGEALLCSGRTRDALATWRSLEGRDAASVAGWMASALVVDADLPSVPSPVRAEVRRGLVGWFGRWLDAAAYESLDRALLAIDRAEAVLPGIAGETAAFLEGVGQGEAAARIRRVLAV